MKILYPSYGALGFALSVVGIPLFMYLPTYYASDIGVDITTVGIVLFVARALDMAIDPLIGHWSDQTKKRKPFIIAGSFLLLIGYYLLIHPLAYPVIWLFILSMVVYIAWSLISVPYMALSSEITRDYHEKTTLSSWREVLTLLGMMSALSLPYLLNISDNYGATLQSLYLLLLISLPIALAALLWGVNNTFTPIQSIPFIQGLKTILKSNGVFLVLAYCINALANAVPSTLFLYYVAHILHVPQESGMLLLLYFTAGIVALPFWSALSRYIGKKNSWIASMVLASCAFVFVPLLGNGDLLWFILIVLISGFSLGADLVLSSSLQADLAQKFVAREQPLSGVLFGLWGMGTKLSLALGVGIAFGILGYFDFNPVAPSHQSHVALVYLYGISPVVLKMLSISILVKFKENELT